jgi:hypothetical protein
VARSAMEKRQVIGKVALVIRNDPRGDWGKLWTIGRCVRDPSDPP